MKSRVWLGAALVAGILYLVIGRAFAVPATHVIGWRWAAWLASGIVFAAHIGYEHTRLRHPPRFTALHASVGVAIGAFGLAVMGALHSLSSTSTNRSAWFLALVAWPAFTAIPAFCASFVAALVLARLSRSAGVP
jgi:hypothetical protein